MKQKIFVLGLFLLAASAAFYFVSCKKEKVYSCNDKLNDYATINMKSNQTISRAQLVTMGIDTQFAIFNSLSSNNKVRIFKEKIQLLLGMDTVPNDDKIHLKKIQDYITGQIYEENNIESDAFFQNWESYAYNSLKWEDIKMKVYVYTWFTPDELFGRRGSPFTLSPAETDGGGGGAGDMLPCVCRYDFVCGSWNCADGCTKTDSGCGIIGTSRCTGTCKP